MAGEYIGSLLFRCGVAVMVVSVVALLICLIFFWKSSRTLNEQLDREFGPKHS